MVVAPAEYFIDCCSCTLLLNLDERGKRKCVLLPVFIDRCIVDALGKIYSARSTTSKRRYRRLATQRLPYFGCESFEIHEFSVSSTIFRVFWCAFGLRVLTCVPTDDQQLASIGPHGERQDRGHRSWRCCALAERKFFHCVAIIIIN